MMFLVWYVLNMFCGVLIIIIFDRFIFNIYDLFYKCDMNLRKRRFKYFIKFVFFCNKYGRFKILIWKDFLSNIYMYI